MDHNGVTTLEGLRGRCQIDDITGCWIWKWGRGGTKKYPIPTVHIGAGVLGFTSLATIPAYRAAWMLSGKKIKPGHVVYRYECGNFLCCNPKHLKCGPRAEMYGHYASTNKNKGQPHRKVANEKNRRKMMVSVERVQEVERRLKEGQLQKQISAEMNMCGTTVRKIRLGLHPNCTRETTPHNVIRGASIFSLGRVAA